MNMYNIGELIKSERIKKNISLQQAADDLKISLLFLKVLKIDDDFKRLRLCILFRSLQIIL